VKRRELILSLVVSCLVFVAVGVFNNAADIVKTIERLRIARESESGLSGLPVGPFIWRGVKYVAFYPIMGLAVGLVLAVLAHLVVRPVKLGSEGANDAAESGTGAAAERAIRKRFLWTFVALLVALIVYVHLRMLTLHPALFDYSYLVAGFAGNPFWVLIVGAVGKIVPVLLALFLVRKYQGPIAAALQRARFVVAVGLALVLVGAGAWWGLTHFRKTPPTNQGPNVILVALDSLRPDHISWKGLRRPYRVPTTPNIDAFLQDCVWFDQVFVPLARTYPSWISMLTGCWPPTTGIRCDLPPRDEVLPRVPTFAQTLQRAGYKTAFFLDNTNFAWMSPEVGFDTIVQPRPNVLDFYVSSVQPPAVLYYYFVNNRLGYLFDPGLWINAAYGAIHRPEFMEREMARFISKMKYQTKFFQAIHLCSIHVPFCVSYPYSTYFAPSFGPVLNRFGYRPLSEEVLEKKRAKKEFADQERYEVFTQEINLYDALARSADDAFGTILDAIRDAGLYDNSFIILTADHGENLPEEGLRYRYRYSTHGFFLWGDGDTRVPLAIKFPKQQYKGRRVERLVRSIDLAPTLLESLGLPPLEKAAGVSRMADVRGQADDRERWVYAETGLSSRAFFIADHLDYEFDIYPQAHEVDPATQRIYKKKRYQPNLVTTKDRMIRTEQWKLISYPIVTDAALTYKTELFDITTDPHNCNDVSTSHPEVLKELRARLWPYIEQDRKEFGTGALAPVAKPDRLTGEKQKDEGGRMKDE
jgi:arylsulfatase A-like enzyme